MRRVISGARQKTAVRASHTPTVRTRVALKRGQRALCRQISSNTAVRNRTQSSGDHNGGNNDRSEPQDVDSNRKPSEAQLPHGFSALSVADRVVTEYERLLEAMPVLARHMGRLQEETEAMSNGLERRVQHLVTGYRELNDLAERTPLFVAHAASDYAQALSGHPPAAPPTSAGQNGGDEQVLDVEGIYRELFALREAKLALDRAVTLSAAGSESSGNGFDENGSDRRRAGNAKHRSLNQEKNTSGTKEIGARSIARNGESAEAKRVRPAAGGRGSGKSSEGTPRASSHRRALAEVQVDPDVPLPLPTFPGYERLRAQGLSSVGGKACGDKNGRNGDLGHRIAADRKGKKPHLHELFGRGAAQPRQRQSHGLPQELRAISTIPKPERMQGNANAATSRRRRRRHHPDPAAPPGSTASVSVGHHKDLGTRPLHPPILNQQNHRSDQNVGDAGRVYGRAHRVASTTGSAAAAAAAREQRKDTLKALEELRREMREREDRLVAELEKMKQERTQRVEPVDATDVVRATGAASARPAAAGARWHGDAAAANCAPAKSFANGRTVIPDRKRKPILSSSRRFNPASAYGKPPMRRTAASGSHKSRNVVGGVGTSMVATSARKKTLAFAGNTASRAIPATAISHEQASEHGGEEKVPALAEGRSASLQTADAQAQTAVDGVHLYLPPAPARGAVLRGTRSDQRPLRGLGQSVVNEHTSKTKSVGVGITYNGDDMVPVDSLEGEDGVGDSALAHDFVSGVGSRGESVQVPIPPPPVVYVEGEGRNTSWRPADDGRLLNARRNGGDSRGDLAGHLTSGLTTESDGSRLARQPEATREGLPEEVVFCARGEAQLVLSPTLDNDNARGMEGRMRGGGGGGDGGGQEEGKREHMRGSLSSEKSPRAAATQRTIMVTTGCLELPSEHPSDAVDDESDRFVEIGGMSGLTAAAAAAPAVPPAGAQMSLESATEGKEKRESAEVSSSATTVTPELIELMREVVGQQRGLGEERALLMQALRVEMENRSHLLSKREQSLRARETALEKREADADLARPCDNTQSAAAAAAAARAAEATGYGQEQQDQQLQQQRQGPDVERSDTGDEEEEEDDPRPEKAGGFVGEEGTKSPANVAPTHAFRSNLGRMLAGGGGWTKLPLDEVNAPGKTFATSLGRVLAGGPAWQRLPLRDGHDNEDSTNGHAMPWAVFRNEKTEHKSSSQTGAGLAARDDVDVQEVLWEAEREARTDEEGHYQIESPETAARKRALAMESRRYLASKAERDRKRLCEANDDWNSSLGAEGSKGVVPATDACVQTDAREGARPSPSTTPVIATTHPTRDGAGGGGVASSSGEKLELSLAKVVLAMVQRVGDVEESSNVRTGEAQDVARQAMEETRKEAKASRDRQSEVIVRLQEMDESSRQRAQAVARELAKLREEGRLARERASKAKDFAAPPQLPTPTTPAHSWIGSSGSESVACSAIERASPASGVDLEDLMARSGPLKAVAPLSASMSSISEGQIHGGSFSDGELVKLTPRGRRALEEGELHLPLRAAPIVPPPTNLLQTRPPLSPHNSTTSQVAVGTASSGDVDSLPRGSGGGGRRVMRGSAAAVMTGTRDVEDLREKLTMIVSAHPRVEKRPNRRARTDAALRAGGVDAVIGQAQELFSETFSERNEEEEGKEEEKEEGEINKSVAESLLGRTRSPFASSAKGEDGFQHETAGMMAEASSRCSASSRSESTWSSREPGQADYVHRNERARRHRPIGWSDGTSPQSLVKNRSDLRVGKGMRQQVGPWHRDSVRHSINNAGSSLSSSGVASSGREQGEGELDSDRSIAIDDVRLVEDDLVRGVRRDFEVGKERAAGGWHIGDRAGVGMNEVTRPLARLRRGEENAGLRSLDTSKSDSGNCSRRRRRAEIDRTVAEAELDTHSDLAADHTEQETSEDMAPSLRDDGDGGTRGVAGGGAKHLRRREIARRRDLSEHFGHGEIYPREGYGRE